MSRKKAKLPGKYQPGVLLKLDARTRIYKRLRSSYQQVVADLGGEAGLSHVQLCLIERYVFLNALIAEWEAAIAADPLKNADLVGRAVQASNAAQGLAKAIGIKRQATAAPSLRAYVEAGGSR